GFSKTTIPVKLLKHEGEELISRSQAKRLIARFDRFKEVILDFEGVKTIGQSFADEVFRVFRAQNPTVHLTWINTNEEIDRTIKHVLYSK
ncbi:MAG: STAS-like domain-containing protein, partial [Candidatus Omnitrophota bacterium]